MHWTQILLAAALIVQLGAFVVILVVLKHHTNASPRRRHTGGHHPAALLGEVATLLFLRTLFVRVTAIAYSLDARSAAYIAYCARTGRYLPR